MMKSFAASLILATFDIVKAIDEVKMLEGRMLDYEFQTYSAYFGKIYSTIEEYEKRRTHFMEIDHVIRKHNADSTQTFRMGHNQFSDYSTKER